MPTLTHPDEVSRLIGQLGRLRAVIDTILALMDELKGGTIEMMMAKSDLEVGLEMLLRRPLERDR